MKNTYNQKIVAVLFACTCLILINTAHAQKLVFLFGHGIYATPLDKNFKDGYNYGLGIEGGAGLGWGKTFIIGTSGFTEFKSADGNMLGHIVLIPVKLGLRQYVFSKLIYLHGDLGIMNIKYKNASTSESKFSSDFGVGVKLTAFEVQLDYDGFSRSDPSGYASWIGIKAGFAIGL